MKAGLVCYTHRTTNELTVSHTMRHVIKNFSSSAQVTWWQKNNIKDEGGEVISDHKSLQVIWVLLK